MKFVNFLKSRLIFNIFYGFCMFLHISIIKRCVNVKSSTHCFQMKTKILADFQICISAALKYSTFKPVQKQSV